MEFESADIVRKMAPDFSMLSAVSGRGLIVTSRVDDDRFDFISRFFAPAAGVNEDPGYRVGPLLPGAFLGAEAG